MASKFLLALALSLLVSATIGEKQPLRLTPEQQCRLQRLTTAQPSQRIESEGGVTELWDEKEDQFQCAGVLAVRNTLRPNALSLPNYHPTPRLVYVERGQGFIGINFPGCAEAWEEKQGGIVRDLHQKVHRIRRGDIVAIPAGVAHWCYNDGNEELVAVSINDLNHLSNQLDQKFRAFYLAGGVPRSGQQEQARETFYNIIQSFDPTMLADAYNVPEELVRRMQTEEKERGLIVMARERMSFIHPEEEREQREWRGERDNGLEETLCTMKISFNLESRREADIYSRQAGKVNIVDRHKLPILKYLDLSAEKGNLFPNGILSPHWSMHGHSIYYVTRGNAQVQIADQNEQALMNDRVNQGDMFVVPQFYTVMAQAGNDGFEWVAFKTTGTPTSNTLAGYTSVIRAMPLQVLTNAYQMSPRQAQGLKMNRGGQSLVLSPAREQQY
ncbi:hypothetical protein CDL12_16381 [Handroanthus impetiginosus]|uniref:Cupin type-1 domain-containing protein n=1 Tax=Handroanthus impetiginosus TaxID=429701 RepID=A0A2G9H0H2_9LAMI|nr:hypothetical protein CDL12_16381 [Handroanthus impetiginosus]